MSIQHAMVFPTVISKKNIEVTVDDKERIFNVVENNLNENGYTMDFLGYTTIHHDPLVEHIYKQIVLFVREHLDHMMIDHSNLNINIVKSWFNLTDNFVNTRHNHSEAHYSVTFYPNVPIDTAKYIRFFRKSKHPNEIYEGFFDNLCTGWDIQNSTSCTFLPEEGDLFLFPASMDHDVVLLDGTTPIGFENVKSREHLQKMRICIGSDVIITSKNKNLNHRVLQPIHDWRTFE